MDEAQAKQKIRDSNHKFKATHKCLAAWFTNAENVDIEKFIREEQILSKGRSEFFRTAVFSYIREMKKLNEKAKSIPIVLNAQ